MISIFGKLYSNRFSEKEIKVKQQLWKTLCREFFQNFISSEDTVVDMGAGFCEFVNSINAKKKIAIDRLSIVRFAEKDVKILKTAEEIEPNSINVVFMSNFLEHLLHIEDVFAAFREVQRMLMQGGKIIIIGPNMRFAYRDYWNFIDHRLALSDLSIEEVLNTLDFKIIKKIPRFLPFSTKSKYPKWNWLVWIYLKVPFLWRFFGKQYLIIGEKQREND